jgi:hypothetical protein
VERGRNFNKDVMKRFALVFSIALCSVPASARDDGRYAGSSGVSVVFDRHVVLTRNDGKYSKNDPLSGWFDSLRDKNGQQCCADADGATVKDVDWTAVGAQRCRHTPVLSFSEETSDYDGRYCVRYKGEWWLVPERATMDEPNRYGPAIVWPICKSPAHVAGADACADDGSSLYFIRCFIPGAGA